MKLVTYWMLILLLFVFIHPATAQQLDVEGEAKIEGRLNLTKTGTDHSIFVGLNAGINDDGTGNKNIFIGADAGAANTTGFENVYIGHTAGQLSSLQYENTFIGNSAGEASSSGNRNTFLGARAGISTTSGTGNTFIGALTAFGHIAGYSNLAVGYAADFTNPNVARSTILGAAAEIHAAQNAIAIGFGALVDCDNCAVIGGTGDYAVKLGINTTTPMYSLDIQHENALPSNSPGNGINIKNLGGNNHEWQFYVGNLTGNLYFYKNAALRGIIEDASGNYMPNSDKKLKKDIKTLKKQLPLIQQLRPTSYRFKDNPSRKVYGLIAQEVQEVLPEIVVVNEPENPNGQILGVSYTELIPVLIAGMQELTAIVDEKDKEVANLKKQLSQKDNQFKDLEQRLSQLEEKWMNERANNYNSSPEISQQQLTLSTPVLEQNSPNPFNSTTQIRYFIPKGYEQAALQIANNQGQIIQTLPLTNEGQGAVNLQIGHLAKGNYAYSLVLDGKVFPTRQMIVH